MAGVLDDIVDPRDLKSSEVKYQSQLTGGQNIDPIIQFQYAWCLVRSSNHAHMKLGMQLLQDLFHKAKDEQAKRDYVYYIGVANAKLKNYEEALRQMDGILYVQPGNHQVRELRKEIEKRMRNDGLIGIALVGGVAAAAIGGLVGLGFALKKGR